MAKRVLIKDPVWGNVELFSWESCVTDHFILNRLTNVIQNSSAFRAYPGLRYSRFLHTIGVVHVVTRLFASAVANADRTLLVHLRKEAAQLRLDLPPQQIASLEGELLGCLGGNREFAVLLATLRIAAFVHDLGHLPYSHVFENAISSLLLSTLDNSVPLSQSARGLRKELGDLLHAASDEQKAHSVHELIGCQLAIALAEDLKAQNSESAHMAGELIHQARKVLQSQDLRWTPKTGPGAKL